MDSLSHAIETTFDLPPFRAIVPHGVLMGPQAAHTIPNGAIRPLIHAEAEIKTYALFYVIRPQNSKLLG